jgi:hypothetical protein
MASPWPRAWSRRRCPPIVRGDVPAAKELTATQRRAVARMRAGRPDALLLWRRERDTLMLEISAPPNPREPGHMLVIVAFARDGSVRVERPPPAR